MVTALTWLTGACSLVQHELNVDATRGRLQQQRT
jgi:hypothetical protein